MGMMTEMLVYFVVGVGVGTVLSVGIIAATMIVHQRKGREALAVEAGTLGPTATT